MNLRHQSLLLVLLLWLSHPALSMGSVDPTEASYRLQVTDISVQVLGGQVSFSREWRNDAWRFGAHWPTLDIERMPDGRIARIQRERLSYERLESPGATTTLFRGSPGLTIRSNQDGSLRWQDRNGNWMDYDNAGKPLRFGNAQNQSVRLGYNQHGQMIGAFDHLERQVLWMLWQDGKLVAVHDAATPARQVSYEWQGDELESVIDVRNYRWRYQYQGSHLTRITNPLDEATQILHAHGRVHQIIDANGVPTRYEFNYNTARRQYHLKTFEPDGMVTEVWTDRERETVRRDINGVTVLRVLRDGRNRIHIDWAGRRTEYRRDHLDNVTQIIYPDASRVQMSYHGSTGLLRTRSNELGTITEYRYDAAMRLIRTIEARDTEVERHTEYQYDSLSRLTHVIAHGDEHTETSTTEYRYDDYGNVTKIIDAEGHEARYEDFDTQGNPARRIDAEQHVWAMEHDAAGNLTAHITPLGHRTEHAYDALGRRWETRAPAATPGAPVPITVYQFDAAGRLRTVEDAMGGITEYRYTPGGKLFEVIDPSGETQRTEYDSFGRVSKVIDAADNETVNHYPNPLEPGAHDGDLYQPVAIDYPTFREELRHDLRGRVRELQRIYNERDSIGQSVQRRAITRYQFDAAGQMRAEIDPLQRESRREYDVLGRMTAEISPPPDTDAEGIRTEYHYDRHGRLIRLTDGNSNSHVFGYDRVGRQIRESRPMGQTQTYDYHPKGQLARRTDAQGQRSEHFYDDDGHRIRIEYFAAGADTPAKIVHFQPDARGNVLGYQDGLHSGTAQFDLLDQLVESSTDYGPFQLSHSYAYQANRRLSQYTAPDGTQIDYQWNEQGRLAAVTIPGEGDISYSQYQWQSPTRIDLPDGSRRQFVYDGLMRPEQIRLEDPQAQVLQHLDYRFDLASNIIEQVTEHGAYQYSYDGVDRLTAANYPNSAGIDTSFAQDTFPYPDDSYTYDPLGNRLTDIAQTNEQAWQYNANNELLDAGFEQYVYNVNGSTIERRDPDGILIQRYEYNLEERLSNVYGPGDALLAEYHYDPMGRRTHSILHPGADGHSGGSEPEIEYTYYTDEGYALFFRAEQEQPIFASAELYVYRPGSHWSTDPVAKRNQYGWRYIHSDHVGTPRVTIAGGQVRHERRMRAFGETVEGQGVGLESERMRFPGQYLTVETGWLYNYFRDYEPRLGKYVQSDPIGLGDGLNIYLYAYANSVMYFDPTGELVPAIGMGAAWGYRGYRAYRMSRSMRRGAQATSRAYALGESSDCEREDDDCRAEYTACLESGLGGIVGWDSVCYHCFERCRGSGRWPDEVINGTWGDPGLLVSCRHWEMK